MKATDPDVVEEWKWMGTPVWSHDGIICAGLQGARASSGRPQRGREAEGFEERKDPLSLPDERQRWLAGARLQIVGFFRMCSMRSIERIGTSRISVPCRTFSVTSTPGAPADQMRW